MYVVPSMTMASFLPGMEWTNLTRGGMAEEELTSPSMMIRSGAHTTDRLAGDGPPDPVRLFNVVLIGAYVCKYVCMYVYLEK